MENKAKDNLQRFIQGATSAFLRNKDNPQKIEHHDDDPVISVRPVPLAHATVYMWSLICPYDLQLDNVVDTFQDAGEARTSAMEFMEKERATIKLEILKARARAEKAKGNEK